MNDVKVIFRTNLDQYQGSKFPEYFVEPPRKGDMVQVKESFVSYFREKKLPIELEVVGITWKEKTETMNILGDRISKPITVISCELWYREIDVKLMKAGNINPF